MTEVESVATTTAKNAEIFILGLSLDLVRFQIY